MRRVLDQQPSSASGKWALMTVPFCKSPRSRPGSTTSTGLRTGWGLVGRAETAPRALTRDCGYATPPSTRRAIRHQPSQHTEVNSVHVATGSVFLGRLQDHRPVAEAWIVDQQAERFRAQTALADRCVPIDPAAPRFEAIVDVKDLEPAQADHLVEFLHRGTVLGFRVQGVAGGEDMAGIEADAVTVRLGHERQDAGQVFEAVPQRTPLAGSRF